jgi:hypothetical protein
MKRNAILGAVLAVSLMGFGAAANAQYTAIVATAPPAPYYEVVPAPRAGFVWDAGHWEFRGNRFVWVPGRWMQARNGYEWHEHRWVQRANGEWVLVGGSWHARGPHGDRDRDGIANRYDRDRDGDGIRNRWDDRPNRADRDDWDEPDTRRMGNRRANRFSPNGDYDRDGLANRHDRDIDGDGVRNRRDAFPYDHRRD